MNFYKKELDTIKKANIFRQRKLFDNNTIDLASNDYLGLSSKKELLNKAYEIVKKEKFNSSRASILVNGYNKIHKNFEEILSKKNNFEQAIILGSGFLANIALIEALVRKKDILFIDEEYHASGMLASKLLGNKVVIFEHNNYIDLEEKLKKYRYNRAIIAIEGIYSMSGDLALFEFSDIAKKYNALLIVDEAHSSGVIGKNLLGWYDYYNLDILPNFIKMGTLGKAYGSYGAYILASNEIISFLENRAKSIIYTTALSLFDTALGLVGFEYIVNNINSLKKDIQTHQNLAMQYFKKIDSLILPIEINNNKKVIQIQQKLLENNILVGAIRTPTVKKAIIRTILRLDIKNLDIYLQKIKDMIND